MKNFLFVVVVLIALAAPCRAAWGGGLNLDTSVQPLMLRELHDGQWLAGVAKDDIWHLDQDGVQRLHAGVFQAWNAEGGNASFGLITGVDLPANAGPLVQSVGDALGFSQTFKPLQYIGSALSVDFAGGYRPVHSADTHAWIYGVGAKLKVSFGVQELKKGL